MRENKQTNSKLFVYLISIYASFSQYFSLLRRFFLSHASVQCLVTTRSLSFLPFLKKRIIFAMENNRTNDDDDVRCVQIRYGCNGQQSHANFRFPHRHPAIKCKLKRRISHRKTLLFFVKRIALFQISLLHRKES